jgi:hypothetical protein
VRDANKSPETEPTDIGEKFAWFVFLAYYWTGIVIGSLAALVTFIVVYVAAVGSVGWVIGIALGWIPAGLAAALAGTLVRWLWPLIAIGIGFAAYKFV